MIKYLKKYWLLCLVTAIAMVIEVCMDLQLPNLMRVIVDKGIVEQNTSVILHTGLKMLLFVGLGLVCGISAAFGSQVVSQNVGNAIRKDYFGKVMSLSFGQIDQLTTGSLINRMSNDVIKVQQAIVMFLRAVIRSCLLFTGGIVMIFGQSVKFGLILLSVLPVMIIILVLFVTKATPMFSVAQQELDNVNSIMDENLQGSRVVKAYVKEDYEIQRFGKANKKLWAINQKVQKFLAWINPITNIIFNFCIVGILYLGGWLNQNNLDVMPGQIMASITYVSIIMMGMMFMANVFQAITRAKVSLDRVKEVLNMAEDMADGQEDTTTDVQGKIKFSNVSFKYPSSPQNVLENINLTINPGETLAIIGATGSGKTTLINLIPRFYDVISGEIEVDNIPIQNYTKHNLRQKIAIVMQTSELYNQSIKSNIAMSKIDANDSEIIQASKVAQADDFINQTEEGYSTIVYQQGHSLSGGQKQRISIARAVLKNPEIIILDDATSALDTKTEAEFFREFNTKYPDTTKVIVGQRISTVKTADRIVVLEQGQIVACGNHQQLLQSSKIYQDIYDSQVNGGSINE